MSDLVERLRECAKLEIDNTYACAYLQEAADEIERMYELVNAVHPRVWKLVCKKANFIIIGEHEPYYMDAYAMIREQEMKQGTWTEGDRISYAAAQLARRSGSDAIRTTSR